MADFDIVVRAAYNSWQQYLASKGEVHRLYQDLTLKEKQAWYEAVHEAISNYMNQTRYKNA